MNTFLDEATLEQAILALFGELGYQTAHGPTIGPNGETPERTSYAEVILLDRLRAALERINAAMPADAIEAAIKTLTRSEGGTLLEENRRLHAFLVEGVAVEYAGTDGRPAHGLVRVFDFDNLDNNDWLAVNQFSVAERASGRPHPDRRPDVVIFVNGLPLAVLELKNPADTQATLRKAFGQLQTYKQQMPDLFVCNELLIVSDGNEAKLGTISADWERFAPWKTIDGQPPFERCDYDVLLRGVFDKRRLLDIVRGFIVFDDGPHALIKKVAGYHQYHAVKAAVARTVEAMRRPKDHKIGVVWHTQGSGKSLTMVFYAGQLVLHSALQNPTLVLITDRNDLDGQLYQNFVACRDLLRQEPVQAESAADLRQKLSVVSGGIIFSTIQLFHTDDGGKHPALTERGNVIVIADEAHRSQYALEAKVNKETGELSYGFARNLREALPNAAFIGFTGTPLETRDKVTTNVFGPVIDPPYDIQQAVADGATVPIYYENRLAKLELDEIIKGELDESFNLLTAEAEDPRQLQRITLEKLVGAKERVERVAADIVEHFEMRTANLPGKAMVVAISRRVCVALYNEIVRLRPDWHDDSDDAGRIKVVMTGSAADDASFQPHLRAKRQLDRIAERLKDPADPLQIVIVCDMWLTGFDAPCLHTMYLDKPLKAHGLMQAIARVNRVFGAKPSGLVVDYLGLAAELRAALHTYTAAGGRGKPALDQSEAVKFLQEKLSVVRDMLHGLDYRSCLNGTPAERLAGVRRAWDYLADVSRAELKQRFLKQSYELHRGLRLASGTEEARAVDVEVGFFMAVRSMFVKTEGGGGVRRDDLDAALQQLVSRALVSEGILDVFQVAGLKKPDISILTEEFLAELRNMPQRNLAAELLARLLRDEIRSTSRQNVVRAEQFSQLLEEAITRYQNRSIEAAQVIEEMLALAREIREANRRGEQLGLAPEEVSFYDALGANDSAVQVMGTPILCELARELVKSIRSSVTIDWLEKDSVRAELRTRIKRLLRRYKYPPDRQEKAIDTVLKQAKLLCSEWASA